MSDTNTPHDDFADVEKLWQSTADRLSPQLAARWSTRVRAELANERNREPSWFGWAVAAAIVLGMHLNLAASNSGWTWNESETFNLAILEAAANKRDHLIATLEAMGSAPARPISPTVAR